MPRKESAAPISAQAQQDLLSDNIENFELPKSLVTKIAKSAISDTSRLQKDVVLSITKSSTVFINYLAATAHDVALSKQHKSISASDVLKALEMIEFGDIVDKLQTELQTYRDIAKSDKSKKSFNHGSSPNKGKSKETDAAAKSKVKAPSASLTSPFTTTPRVSMADGGAEGEQEGEMADGGEPDAEVDVDVDEVEGEEGEQEPTNEEGEGVEAEDEDLMEQEEELKADAMGVEDSEHAHETGES